MATRTYRGDVALAPFRAQRLRVLNQIFHVVEPGRMGRRVVEVDVEVPPQPDPGSAGG